MKRIGVYLGAILMLFILLHVSTGFTGESTVPVLTYHDIQEEGSFDQEEKGRLIVTPEQLEKQLKYLKDAGYETITCEMLYKHYVEGKSLPPKPILITFDDGFKSTYDLGLPIFKKLGTKVCIFVPTISIRDENNPDLGKPSYFTWQQAKEMADTGLVEIQSHTHGLHRKIPTQGSRKSSMITKLYVYNRYETEKQYKMRIFKDAQQSALIIKNAMGKKPIAIAFPYGDFNYSCNVACKEAGMVLQFSTREGINNLKQKPATFKRITVDQKFSGQHIVEIIKKYK